MIYRLPSPTDQGGAHVPARRRFRFGLTLLFLVVFGAACGFGWLVYQNRLSEAEIAALRFRLKQEEIEKRWSSLPLTIGTWIGEEKRVDALSKDGLYGQWLRTYRNGENGIKLDFLLRCSTPRETMRYPVSLPGYSYDVSDGLDVRYELPDGSVATFKRFEANNSLKKYTSLAAYSSNGLWIAPQHPHWHFEPPRPLFAVCVSSERTVGNDEELRDFIRTVLPLLNQAMLASNPLTTDN